MKRLALLSPLMFGLLLAPNALALSARTISTEQAQGNTGSIVTLEVAPGYGLNINLIPTGEVVKKAWIDDPSQIVLSFDGNLCQSSGDSECNNEGATVIHLRQIKPIAFPDLPRSPGGGTLLTLITEGGSEGRKIYQFKVVPTSGQPKYTVLSISPEVEAIAPVLPPALPRQNLPMVEAPIQPPTLASEPQWQAQTPSQPNSIPSVVSSPPPGVTATTSSVATEQVAVVPNQSPVTPTDVITAAPKIAPVTTKTPPSVTTRSNQNEMVAPERSAVSEASRTEGITTPYEQTLPDGSAPQEQKVTSSSPTANTSATNSLTPDGTNANRAKVPSPIALPPTSTNNMLSSSTNNSLEDANALVRGLVIARQKGQINHGTTTWKEVQSVVRLLRRGDTKHQATKEVGISLQLIDQLIAWGQRSTVASN